MRNIATRPANSRSRAWLARTWFSTAVPVRFQYSILPSSIPRSVTTPVMCVVRICDDDILVTVAFCSPMMKDSSSTVMGTEKGVRQASVRAPTSPNTSMSSATSTSGSA